jgi:hypothetical protein
MTDTRELVRFTQTERAMPAILTMLRVRPRTVLVAAALAMVTIGLAMNWSALVAAGIAPLLISALPCAVMCALGLCMSRMGRSSCATETAPQQSAGATPLQVNSAPERIEGPQLSFDLGRPSDRDAAGADQTEQQQERRPVNA